MHRRLDKPFRAGRALAGAIMFTCVAVCVSDVSARAQGAAASGAVPQLVAAADWILVADLVEMPVRRSVRDDRVITDYHFSATRTLFGQPSNDLVLSQDSAGFEGGDAAAAAAPAFVLGARYLLFVRAGSSERRPIVVGGAQGVYRLSIDGKAMALGGEREILRGEDLLAEIDRLVALRKAPGPAAAEARASERHAAYGH